MFGRYFHAICYHAPLVHWIRSPSSLHTELQERMFNQLQSITRNTSNHSPNQIIFNTLIRIQEEENSQSSKPLSCLKLQEGTVSKLQKCSKEKSNNYPSLLEDKIRPHLQAHLERISDFLVDGPNSWWKCTPQGIEFFDETNPLQNVDCRHNFRSSSLADIDTFLLNKWEKCIELNFTLPATNVRTFQ